MSLDELREQINQVDDQLSQLFARRMALSAEVAEQKRETGAPVFDPSRERAVVARLTEGMDDERSLDVKLLYNTIFDLSRARQQHLLCQKSDMAQRIHRAIEQTPPLFPKKAVVACQGVEGGYGQQAADKLFSMPSLMYCKRFEAVFQAIQNGLCQYGVLPVENSSFGTVGEVYDLMRRYRFSIVRSVRLKINHRLLALPGTKLTDIREVISHEQALGQCSEFLKTLKDVKLTVCENTAAAAQRVALSGRSDVAALASPECAALYGLSALDVRVSNSDSNFTRFICIARELEVYPGANRMSLMLNVEHKSGALYRMIARFAALGLNLTKLESRPIAGTDFEFLFYVDLDASAYDPAALGLLSELDAGPELISFLGAYQEL